MRMWLAFLPLVVGPYSVCGEAVGSPRSSRTTATCAVALHDTSEVVRACVRSNTHYVSWIANCQEMVTHSHVVAIIIPDADKCRWILDPSNNICSLFLRWICQARLCGCTTCFKARAAQIPFMMEWKKRLHVSLWHRAKPFETLTPCVLRYWRLMLFRVSWRSEKQGPGAGECLRAGAADADPFMKGNQEQTTFHVYNIFFFLGGENSMFLEKNKHSNKEQFPAVLSLITLWRSVLLMTSTATSWRNTLVRLSLSLLAHETQVLVAIHSLSWGKFVRGWKHSGNISSRGLSQRIAVTFGPFCKGSILMTDIWWVMLGIEGSEYWLNYISISRAFFFLSIQDNGPRGTGEFIWGTGVHR